MKPLYILKLGGSVITYKNRRGGQIRKTLLEQIAQEIFKSLKKKDFSLILIHGAGSTGHQLAHKYKLVKGASQTKNGWKGSLISRVANQRMDVDISGIFIKNSLPVVSVHTSSVIIQDNKKIDTFNLDLVGESLKQNCIPLLYGEMVFDRKLGMTICSGDVIAPYLAKEFKADKIFFASDVSGIFTKDPHLHKDAILIEKIRLNDIKKSAKLSRSHNIDVTEGFIGKIKKLEEFGNPKLKSIEIFNGFKKENYKNIFSEKKFPHTTIQI